MTDKELIQACRKNDRRAQNELYKRYFPLMSSIAMRYCSSVDDVHQMVNMGFLKVLQNIKQYNGKHKLATWMRTLLVNQIIDQYRKEKKHISSVYVQYDEVENTADHSLSLAEYHFAETELREMLAKLPSVSGTVFNLFAIDGFSHKEIASKLGISVGTSKWHVNEARRKLKKMLVTSSPKEKKMKQVNYE